MFGTLYPKQFLEMITIIRKRKIEVKPESEKILVSSDIFNTITEMSKYGLDEKVSNRQLSILKSKSKTEREYNKKYVEKFSLGDLT